VQSPLHRAKVLKTGPKSSNPKVLTGSPSKITIYNEEMDRIGMKMN
jgi:hypothetical protein